MKRTTPAIASFLISLLLSAVAATAAPTEKDLGQGLKYLRTADAKADAAAITAALGGAALILDLRNAEADEISAQALASALDKSAGRPRTVQLVLINGTTSPLLIAATAIARPGVVTLGPASPAITPDVAVATSREDDRQAYDALTAGTPLEKLIDGAQEKRRFDEATLAHDHNGASRAPDRGEPTDAGPSTSPKDKATAPPPIDRVLQRAVHTHRALLALKKL
jgi:hypothetical protein